MKHDNLFLFPNWVDTKFITPLGKKESLLEKLGYCTTDFIVLYSGNMGEKQGLEIVVEAAALLKDKPHIQFALVGEGSTRERLMNATEKNGLKNIRFFPLQPYSDLPKLLAMADIHLVLQKKSASDLVLPSKLTGILSAGGVLIVTTSEGSFLHQEIKQHNLGVIIEPENGKLLSEAILSLMNDTTSTKFYKQNAIKYAERFLNKDTVLSYFEQALREIC